MRGEDLSDWWCHLLGMLVFVAVGAQPGAPGHAGPHLRQRLPVPHQQACPAEAPTRPAAPAALRFACLCNLIMSASSEA